ncbi:MAG TPA: prepilin-type N-terminal cleavage/methylation domain-containing protein [Pyrinomonadaceae bacterium]|jgi:type II secretory pathway pseudopilin PulG
MSNNLKQKKNENSTNRDEKGFSLIEAVVAILIITIGLIGTAAAITYALEFSAISRNVSNAKLVIVSTIEEIESLRNTRRLDFKQIANVGGVDNNGTPNTFNGFSSGYKEVSLNPGPDGVNGTDDDLRSAGADGTYGTGDDVDDPTLVRSGYVREITITNLNTTLKKVEIKVRYFGAGGKIGEIRGVSYINDESRITR